MRIGSSVMGTWTRTGRRTRPRTGGCTCDMRTFPWSFLAFPPSPAPATRKKTNVRSFRNLSAAASAARELLFICEDRKAVKHFETADRQTGARSLYREDAYLRGKMREGQCYSTAIILELCVQRGRPFYYLQSSKAETAKN